MKQHTTYKAALTPGDLNETQREHICATAAEIFDNISNIRIVETEEENLELVVPQKLSHGDRAAVRETIEHQISAELNSHETIVLDMRVTWPNPKYMICVDNQ